MAELGPSDNWTALSPLGNETLKRMSETFATIVPLRDKEECSLARHFHAEAAKDLLYWLEHKAKNNPHRFIFVRPENLPAAVKIMIDARRKKAKLKPIDWKYGHSILEKYLTLFRRLGILTVRFKGKDYRGGKKQGFQMMRHDDLTRRLESGCEWIGMGGPGEDLVRVRIGEAGPLLGEWPAEFGAWPASFHTPPNCPCSICVSLRNTQAMPTYTIGKSGGGLLKSGVESGVESGKSGVESGGERAPTSDASQAPFNDLQRESGGERAPKGLKGIEGYEGSKKEGATRRRPTRPPVSNQETPKPTPPLLSRQGYGSPTLSAGKNLLGSSPSYYASKSDDEKRARISDLRARIKFFGGGDEWLREIEELEKLLGDRK